MTQNKKYTHSSYNTNKKVYLKTEYVDSETGEILDPLKFKEEQFYNFKETIKNETNGTIGTTRVVELKGKKPKQLDIVFE